MYYLYTLYLDNIFFTLKKISHYVGMTDVKRSEMVVNNKSDIPILSFITLLYSSSMCYIDIESQ